MYPCSFLGGCKIDQNFIKYILVNVPKDKKGGYTMGKVSVELVPRSKENLKEQLHLIKDTLPDNCIDIINIPDLLSCELRGYEGAIIAKEYAKSVMPHIRAMDIDITKPLPMAEFIKKNGIHKVLVIEGDPPSDMSHEVYPTETTDVINKFRMELPEVDVYAGIDQYRSSMKSERYRIRRKLQAGAKGFFTQPFFDLRLLGMYEDMLDGIETYWGASPVMSVRSMSYWEQKNNVVFPKDFHPTLEWSVDFSKRMKEIVMAHDGNLYLMPIKANLAAYLKGVFS